MSLSKIKSESYANVCAQFKAFKIAEKRKTRTITNKLFEDLPKKAKKRKGINGNKFYISDKVAFSKYKEDVKEANTAYLNKLESFLDEICSEFQVQKETVIKIMTGVDRSKIGWSNVEYMFEV